ncbi:uncharacterized protein [Cicer arietinum]|uniref:Uncharacterized protein LOC101493201 n=1 Tax=Cicer arietinum TaxID=3827 RepID=A0A1S3E3F6_CICAR|nr:uncharacterized protein LOC101493201 [Cicer arietinum]
MVLMDNKGDKIPATVRKTLISRFQTNIHDGDVYNFRSLGVAIKIECALFGSYVDELNAYLQSGYNQNVVVLAQFLKVKMFNGKSQLQNNMTNLKYYEERAILAPTHDTVDIVNDYVLSLIPGEEKEYNSSDSIVLSGENYIVHGDWFTPESLNDMKCSGISNHRLRLKIGVPVMILRNIDQANRLRNGTRLLINELCINIIGATVITKKHR